MPYFDVGDGREFPLFLPDDLTEEEIQNRIAAYKKNFPLPTVEEKTGATTPTVEETLQDPISDIFLDPYSDIAPKLRPKESYDEGDDFSEQVAAGLESTILSQLSLEDLNNLILETEAAEDEYNQLILKEQNQSLSEEEVKRKQELYITLEGTGKSTSLPDMAPNIGAPGTIPVIPTQMILAEEKGRLGLKQYTNDAIQSFSSLQKSVDETEVSDAFKWVMEQSVDTTGEQGFFEGSKKAFLTFWNDLDRSQKGDFMGDVLGRSAAATSAILATSFGIGGLTRKANWAVKGLSQLFGVGTVSGEIEYSHSMHEYLRAKGLDVNNPESIKAVMGNEELLEEAHDYSLKRGAIIGLIDGLTGGIATKIIAPSVITRSHRSVMPYIKKPSYKPVSPVTRHSVNFVAQTPLQVGLPAGAEYFAQLATLEEGEKISFGEVFAEAIGEFAFVPADMILGGISANQEIKNLTAAKEETLNRVVEELQIPKEQAKQLGLEDLAGEIVLGTNNSIYDTGIPYFNEALDIYQNNKTNINTFANTDADIVAPNQFFVQPDGQGKYVILDTYNEKFGNIYDSKEVAAGVSGALNAISGASYSIDLKNTYATMQGLNVDAETNPLVNKLGNTILNPYFGQIDIQDVNDSANVNSAAYERLINAVGRDATGIDILSLKGVLPEADINRLLDIKAKKLYQDANVGKNLPSNITVKMFENLGKKLNLNIDTNSNGFKSLALRLTGESNVNKLNNAQKRLVYSFLNTLPAHEGNTISLPDFSSRPYTLDEYNQVVDVLNAGQTPTIPNIVLALGLNPNNLADKRTATRLRQDLVSAGIVDKKGSKYKFNANGEWSLNRAQQAAIDSDPQTKVELQEIQKFRSLLSNQYEKMGMSEVAVKLDNAIQTRVGQSNPEAEGQFDPIWSEVLLSVAKAREGTTTEQEVLENLSQTMGHELFHAAMFLDLFSIQERANLNKYVRNNKLNKKSAESLLGKENLKILTDSLGKEPTYLEAIEYRYNTLDNQNLNSEELTEEANALLFEDYINKKRLAGQPRALMERTKKFFTSIDNGMNELGFQTYEDVFDKLVSGEIGARERVDETAEAVEVTMTDEYGRPRGSYEVQPRAIRTNRILENEFAELLRVSETSIGNEFYPESADRDSPMFERPLQDAPNLRYKLSETQQRPTSLTQEYWRGAQNEEYGNDINQIGEVIFARNIVNNTDIIRRLGRTLENSEVGETQRQLYDTTQKFLKNAKNYSKEFPVYVVGDLNRSKFGTVVTNNLEEAENIANEFVDPPFQIVGDRKKITEYTITRPKVTLDKDVMFGAKPPEWAQPSLPTTDFLIVGNNALATAPNQPISYQEKIPPEGVVRRKFNLGTLKTKYKMSSLEDGLTGLKAEEIAPNYRRYKTPYYREGQATYEEKKLLKKLKLSEPSEYRALHQVSIDGSPMHDMTRNMYPEDLYSPQGLQYYGDGGGDAASVESYDVIQSVRNNPDAEVTVYRAVPKGIKTINSGDWVTPSYIYAQQHNELVHKGNGDIIEKTVQAKELITEGNSLNEFGYFSSEPMDDIAFENSKEDLLELMDQGIDVLELTDHPAVVEGMSRMFELQSTADQYINKLGENWSTENAYLNNRKFVINNRIVRGIRKAKAELKKKAESYSNNPVENNKQAWLVLGATASGKSYFSEKLAKEHNLAIVDSDDAKKIIPEYEGGVGANAVHVEASMITSSVRNDFIKEGKDILLPRVGGLPKRKAIQSTIKELQNAGYNIKTVLVDVDYKSALGRMYKRFAKTGRLVPPSYIEETKNTPIDTFHRVKYITDGYAWIDNNGTENQEIIRQDTGILSDAFTGGRGESRRIRRESSEENERSSFPEEQVTIQEALEGVKGINERLVSAGLVPKFNLNASADAIRAAYIAELKKPDAGVIPNKLRSKYSLKDSGSKLNDKTEDLIKKVTIRDSFDSEPSMGRIILETAKGYATEDSIREILVDRYARFKTVEIQAARARGMKEEMLTADVSGVSALMFSDRNGEVFRSAFIEGIPVYDEKGYVRTVTVSPIDGQPVEPPMKFLQPAFENPQLMWAFQAVRIAKREKRFDAEGKPVKTTAQDRKDAAQALKDYPELQEMSDAYDRWDQHVVKFLVDTGVLDVNTAKQWTAHADYFPFYRMIGQDKDGKSITKGPQIFKGLGSGKNIFVKAKGSADKDIVDPITGIGENLRAAITLGMKNVAANRVVRDMVDAGFAEQVPLNSTGFNVVKIRVGGKTKAFRVDDVNLYEAFQNFEGGAINFGGFFSRLTAIPKEALSALITRTPDFWIRQVLRDSISAQTILGGNFIPLGTSLKNWGKVWGGMIANKLPFTERDFVPEGVSKMRRAGIVSGYDTVVRDIDNSQKLIESAYKQAGINNRNTVQQVAMFPFDTIKAVWNFVGDGTISSDAATRLAVYEDILEKTGNEAEAVFQAMEVLNFTRRGKNPLMQYLATVIPFMNPRLQGVDVFYRGARGQYGQPQTSAQARRRAFALRMGMIASLAPMYFFLVKDSDEYKEASEDIRDNYYILPSSKKLFGETIAIPIPFEVGLMTKTVPERILRYYNEDETFKEMFTGMMRRVGQSLSIDPRQATFLNAPIENLTNYDFYTGQPVVPYYMKDLDPQLQYRPSTNNLWKELGDEMNVSPLYLDNLWKGYTGTIGNWVANATDSFSREYLDMPPRQAFRLDEKPAVGALLIDPEGRGLENEFYALKETTDNLFKSMKEAEKRITEGGDEFAYHLTDEYRFEYMETLKLLTQDLNNISELLSETRLEETRILNDRTISSEEKTDQLTDLRDTRNFILKGIGERRMKIEKGLFEDIRGAL